MTFQIFDTERSWFRLFRKRIVRTKLYFYVYYIVYVLYQSLSGYPHGACFNIDIYFFIQLHNDIYAAFPVDFTTTTMMTV